MDEVDHVGAKLLRACLAAPAVLHPQRSTEATLTAERPVVVIRFVIPKGELDATKGEGELGVRGATRTIAVRAFDLATKELVDTRVIGRCFENTIRGRGPGDYCAAFLYDDDENRRVLTFEYDFGAQQHSQATEAAYEGAAADRVCGTP